MASQRGANCDAEDVESAEEDLPELIHETEDMESGDSGGDSAEEEMPELIACDEEEHDQDWIDHADEEELPELICQEAGDGEAECAVHILQGVGGRRHYTPRYTSQHSEHMQQNGDVNAMRVVLLGVSDEGTPSVGIDLGLACPAHGDDFEDGEPCYTMYNECYANRCHPDSGQDDIPVEREAEYSDDGEEIEYETQTSGLDVMDNDRLGGRRMLRLGSPFAFQPPVSPSCTTISFSQSVVPPNKPFLFGSAKIGLGKGGHLPASQEWQSAIEDQDFVKSVLQCLPGVNSHDPKILDRLRKLRIRVANTTESAEAPSETRGAANPFRKDKVPLSPLHALGLDFIICVPLVSSV
jgi:hypothetical protein